MVFNRFSKSSPELEDVEGGHSGGKIEVRRCFNFAMAWWKTLGIENFWNFATFNLFTVPAKIPYLQKYSTDIRNLCLRSKIESVHLGGKFQVRRYFTFAMERRRLWSSTTFEILPISTCTTVPAKILCLHWYSTDFRNLCLGSKIFMVVIWMESFRCAGILLLQWQGEKLAQRQHLKFCGFQHVHRTSKNLISPKVFDRSSKSLPQFENV